MIFLNIPSLDTHTHTHTHTHTRTHRRYLLRILSSPEFQKNYRDSDRKPTDLMFTLRAKKADMASLAYQNAVCETTRNHKPPPNTTQVFAEAIYLLSEHLGNLSHTIGFPELAFPILTRLRRLQKEIRNPKWRQQITTLTQKINTNSAHIVSKRKGVNFGPSEVEKVCAGGEGTRFFIF